jgi:hypothetical protein
VVGVLDEIGAPEQRERDAGKVVEHDTLGGSAGNPAEAVFSEVMSQVYKHLQTSASRRQV